MRLQSILHRYALLLLLLCAFWVRVADLSNAPPGLYYDEAAHGLDALRVWQGELYIFFPTANGHEPLFTYLVAAFVRILGNTILAIRLPAAMLGVLAVAACYALGRRLVGPWQALFAAALVAVTFWTMALSRIGYRANALPVFFLLWLLSFWACRGRHELRPYLVCGLLLGLMQYTYTAARFVPLLALILAWDWRKALDRRGLLVGSVVAALSVLPLGIAILIEPDAGTNRIRDAWIFGRSQPWQLLLRQLRDHILMFGFTGDPLWIHNIPFRPPVWLPLALLFWLGVVTGLPQPAARTLILSTGVLLWPGILAVSNNPAPPDHLRVLVVAAPVFLLIAVGLAALVRQRLQLTAPSIVTIVVTLAAALLALDSARSWRDYQDWSVARETYEQFDADMTRLARKIRERPDIFYLVPLSPDWHEFEPGRHWTIDYLSNFAQNYHAIAIPYQLPSLHTENIALVRWLAGMHLSADPQRTLEGELNLLGYTRISDETENTFLLEYYQRGEQKIEVYRFPTDLRYEGGLRVTNATLFWKHATTEMPAQLIAEIHWESQGPYAAPISVSLRLLSADGATVAQVDSVLWNNLGETAEKWRSLEQSRIFLEFDPAAPGGHPASGSYSVVILPYQTDSLALLAATGPRGHPAGYAEIGLVTLP
jgi:4-amino-4-deoxy-L-arabinose transferase-like glycosyltransferase